MKKKLLIQAIAFMLLVFFMLTGLGLALREKSGSLSGFYALPSDSVSALFVGGSHVNAAYIPATLWSEYGIASHNLFSPNQPLWTSFHYIKEALKTQTPDVIVLELFGLTYGFSYSAPAAIDADNAEAGFHMRLSPNFYAMAAASSVFGVESEPFPDYLNLVRYHYRWKTLSAGDFAPLLAEHDVMRGYELLVNVESFEDVDFTETAQTFEPYVGARIYLERIRRLAESEGVPLVLSISPYAPNETERGIFAWARQYAEENGLRLLNYNGADGARIGIDRSRDLADVGHTNYGGALKVTRDIGEYLKENYPLRGAGDIPDAARRDADAAVFADKAKISADITTSDPAAFFALAAADASYTVFAAGRLDETRLAALSPLGFEGLKAGEPFAGISVGGEAQSFEAREGAQASLDFGRYLVTASADKPAITINGVEYKPDEGSAVFLLYKNDFNWPLDLEWFSQAGELAHREFTSSDLEALTAA